MRSTRILIIAMAAVVGTATLLAGQRERVRAQPTFDDDPMRVTTVPVGTKWDLRLQTLVDSGTAKVDARFEAATILDYSKDGLVLIPAASAVRGFVGSVAPAATGSRGGSVTLAFEDIRIGDRPTRLRASVEQLFKGEPSETSARVGADSAIDAAIRALPGGGQGALVGMLVGPGGSITSAEASDVKLPVGTILRIRIDRPIEIANLPAR